MRIISVERVLTDRNLPVNNDIAVCGIGAVRVVIYYTGVFIVESIQNLRVSHACYAKEEARVMRYNQYCTHARLRTRCCTSTISITSSARVVGFACETVALESLLNRQFKL